VGDFGNAPDDLVVEITQPDETGQDNAPGIPPAGAEGTGGVIGQVPKPFGFTEDMAV